MRKLALFIGALSISSIASAGTVAYQNPAVAGNQKYTGSLGMDFNVISSILITDLGAFDGDQNGFAGSITVGIYARADASHTPLALQTFSGTAGTQIGGDRFITLPFPVLLMAGFQGTVVATGYGTDANGNQGTVYLSTRAPFPFSSTANDGGGLISFVGVGDYGDASYPSTPDSGPANIYGAGDFIFQSTVPEPASYILLGSAFVALGVSKRGRRR